MKCAQQHTTDRHTHTPTTHWHTLANTCTHTTHCRLHRPGTPTAAHQRKKHSVLILIEKLLIFHASSSRGSSRGRPRPLLTPHTHTHVYTQSCLLTHLHIPTHAHAHTHITASALQLLPSELFVLPILQLCVCCMWTSVCVCECCQCRVLCLGNYTFMCE